MKKSFRMSQNIQFTKPSLDLFRLPPSSEPLTLSPQPGIAPYAPSISIPESLYHSALDAKLPITIAVVYVFSVSIINAYNKRRGYKPWSISQMKLFTVLVVLHNILLAVYSGWTYIGMWRTLANTIPSPYSEDGLTGTVDAFCKPHGPKGFGRYITYNSTLERWVSPSNLHLNTETVTPFDISSTGRFWNEGLAFYGWIFYLSKFYELIDTFIILAKGKRSPTLQTYHHTGAMLCMWSGIRYMSPPIWMFVFVNSAIHTLMYTYFAFAAIGLPAPSYLKRSLTSLQILQFLVGSTYAAIHSFISYRIPVKVPYTKTITEVVTSTILSSAAVTDRVKNILVNALGRPNVAVPSQVPLSKSIELVGSRTKYRTVSCIDTSGQTFAIWLNIIYLLPLTVLFVRFFIKSYINRSSKLSRKTGPNVNAKLQMTESTVKDTKEK